MRDRPGVHPPRVRPSREHVSQLKGSCPVELHSAWRDAQWSRVITIAQQRYRISKDEYLLAVEAAARTHLDSYADRAAGKKLVEGYVRDSTQIPDEHALALLEFTCSNVAIDYPKTIGVLRLRLAKSKPKDKSISLKCFEACFWYHDWKNAQQIASSMDRHFPTEKKYRYYNITCMYLLGLSVEESEKDQGMFSSLARLLADREFPSLIESTEIVDERFELWFRIRTVHATITENLDLFGQHLPNPLPLIVLKKGHRKLFKLMLEYLEEHGAWCFIRQIGEELLTLGSFQLEREAGIIEKAQRDIKNEDFTDRDAEEKLNEAIGHARGTRDDKSDHLIVLGCDASVWNSMIKAAAHGAPGERKSNLKRVSNKIKGLVNMLKRAQGFNRSLAKNYDICCLNILFERIPAPDAEYPACFTRVQHLVYFVEIYHSDFKSCFSSLQQFVKRLETKEFRAFFEFVRSKRNRSLDPQGRLSLTVLYLKLWYYGMTERSSDEDDNSSSDESDSSFPWSTSSFHHDVENQSEASLKGIIQDAVCEYSRAANGGNISEDVVPVQAEIAIIGTVCILQLSKLTSEGGRKFCIPLGYNLYADMKLFIQAHVWLAHADSMCTDFNYTDANLRMLLMKLYLYMGSLRPAKAIWESFGVKNATLDSMGLLFFDRLSSMAPGLFISGQQHAPTEQFLTYFTKAARLHQPQATRNGFREGNYVSVIDSLDFFSGLARSCTVVASVIEDRRQARLNGGRNQLAIADDPLVEHITASTMLFNRDDYAAFPNLLEGAKLPVEKMVNVGLLPSRNRVLTGLLTERFMDLVCYVPTRDYKPPNAGGIQQLNWEYAVTTAGALTSDIEHVECLCPETIWPYTDGEADYLNGVRLLCNIIQFTLNFASPLSDKNKKIRVQGEIRKFSHLLLQARVRVSGTATTRYETLDAMASLHGVGMMRELVMAIKHTVSYLQLMFHKAMQPGNRSNPRVAQHYNDWIRSELEDLGGIAKKLENCWKNSVSGLRGPVAAVAHWSPQVDRWVLGNATPHEYAHNRAPYMYVTLLGHQQFKTHLARELSSFIREGDIDRYVADLHGSWTELLDGWDKVSWGA
ncbi:N-acetyltransferase B complex non catalytic subunit-domain-containing protein [Xylariomycetidae sp. FL2044]|nr:N-acetyltransferase B complex non catalytic subunit-domain-containing protein [Xylariomycetidae sp. FL2044]